MREKLGSLDGRRTTFTATYSRSGSRLAKIVFGNEMGEKLLKTLLFTDVIDGAGRIVADHVWFTDSKTWRDLELQPGDRVRFKARVTKYTKGARTDEGDFYRATDYKLSNPTKATHLEEANVVTIESFCQ